jgi:hypothetical protein
MLTAQAVSRAATSIAFIGSSKNRIWSLNESQAESPKVCFFRDSYLVYGWRVRFSRRDFAAVFVDLAAALRAGPAAPHAFAYGSRLANQRQRRAAARTILSERTETPAPLRFGLLPDEPGNDDENDKTDYCERHCAVNAAKRQQVPRTDGYGAFGALAHPVPANTGCVESILRVPSFVIAGLDPAIHAEDQHEKLREGQCRNGS